jgi:hypothetical protein
MHTPVKIECSVLGVPSSCVFSIHYSSQVLWMNDASAVTISELKVAWVIHQHLITYILWGSIYSMYHKAKPYVWKHENILQTTCIYISFYQLLDSKYLILTTLTKTLLYCEFSIYFMIYTLHWEVKTFKHRVYDLCCGMSFSLCRYI